MNETSVREEIAKKIAEWDVAYTQKNVSGYLSYLVSDKLQAETSSRLKWVNLMDCAESLFSQSSIKDFAMYNNIANLLVDVHEEISFKRPNNIIMNLVAGWLSNLVFISKNVRSLIWVNTSKGWLCQDDKLISSKVSIRLKRRSLNGSNLPSSLPNQ